MRLYKFLSIGISYLQRYSLFTNDVLRKQLDDSFFTPLFYWNTQMISVRKIVGVKE